MGLSIFPTVPDGFVEAEYNTEARALFCRTARVVDQRNATRQGVIVKYVFNSGWLRNVLVVEVQREGIGQGEVASSADASLED